MQPGGGGVSMLALKDDFRKTRFDLLPFEGLEEVADVMAHGELKYGTDNWRSGLEYRRLFAAALRHLFSFWDGEDLDPESGCHHLAHAACCCLFILTYIKKGVGIDDRPCKTIRE